MTLILSEDSQVPMVCSQGNLTCSITVYLTEDAVGSLTIEDGVQEKEFPSEAVKIMSSLGHASISVSLFIVT